MSNSNKWIASEPFFKEKLTKIINYPMSVSLLPVHHFKQTKREGFLKSDNKKD
jgi:hypothetical protein